MRAERKVGYLVAYLAGWTVALKAVYWVAWKVVSTAELLAVEKVAM